MIEHEDESMTAGPRGIQVYAHPDGRHYLAQVDGAWWRWPAERDGWRYRQPHEPPDDESAASLPSRLADLALRLSGAGR